MLTEREREILALIEANPMMSQEDLANRIGITRSSMAVHISNLIKKGAIFGKGYVVKKHPYVAVVGGAYMDIIGHPENPAVYKDSPGAVNVSFGGSGRNVAHNLRLLSLDAKMITVFGEDLYSDKLRINYQSLGIDTTFSPVLPNGTTPTYLTIVGTDGQILYSIWDSSKLYESLTPSILSTRMDVIHHSDVCSVETNMSSETLKYLAENCRVPLFVKTISKSKAHRVCDILGKIHTLKTDKEGLEVIVQHPISSREELTSAAQEVLQQGTQRIFITSETGEVLCANQAEIVCLSDAPTKTVNEIGGRDSFMAALIWAYLQGMSLTESAKAGIAATHINRIADTSVNEDMNEFLLRQEMQRIK